MKELPVLRKARSITSKDRPSPRKLITERNVRDLTLTGIAIGGLLAGMICVNSSPTSEVTPTPIVPETVPATQPVIHETPTNIPTEQSAERGAPYPQNKDISPFTMDSEEAYRQETERTVDELILFFNSKGSDGQAEYDFLVQRLYQRLAFDVIRTVNGGAGGEGFDEEIRNSVFPDSKNFFEARINSRSWALVPRDNDGNFWVPGELNADGNFTAYLGLVPPKYITIDDFEMRKVQTPKGTTAHLFTHPSTHIIIEFYDNQTGQLASWWSAADGLIHRIQAPTSTVTPTPTRTPTPTPT